MNIEPEFTLAQLLAGIAEAPRLPVTGISSDSRSIRRGEVFLACRGATHHGLDFLDAVLDRGAAAIVWDGDPAAPEVGDVPVPLVEVPGLAGRLGEIANRYFDWPSRKLTVAGVTGTNGKTTVAWLLAECMQRIERSCAYIGTLGTRLDAAEEPDTRHGLTTPACVDLHRSMADLHARGARFLALEVSSHALRQQRVDGVQFDSALFTNLSRDHVDYHGDMQRYGETKADFILRTDVRRHVISVDCSFGRDLARRCPAPLTVVSTGSGGEDEHESFVRLRVTGRDEEGTRVDAATSWGDTAFRLPLVGRFNVQNAALVLAQLLCWDVPVAEAARVLTAATPPPGRLQRVVTGSRAAAPAVYVDYAHTPAGLEAVLEALRPHCRGALWCVFGCGGDRDRGKRRTMGEVVSALADRAVVTSDNPRGERPGDIIAEVLAGMARTTPAIEDRASAIAYAIGEANDDDVILIAGKGHETFQLIGERRLPFSDYATARSILEARPGASGR